MVHTLNYHVHQSVVNKRTGALIDRGANGGIGGKDVRKLHDIAGTIVDITGIEDHQVRDVPLAVVAGVMRTNRGLVIGIFNNYAYIGKGRTIHSAPQIDHFGHDVNDKSIKVGGSQRITTKNGYIIPISVSNGLPYISMRPPTDKEMEALPHEIMTSPSAWDPSILDHEFDSDDEDFFNALEDSDVTLHDHVDEFGIYRQVYYNERTLAEASYLTNDYHLPDHRLVHDSVELLDNHKLLEYFSFNNMVEKRDPDFDKLRPNFLYKSDDIIRKTFENTTQMARIPMSTHLRTWYKAPNPAMNTPRRNEDLLTDYVYSSEPAIDDGSTGAQVFFGKDTHVGDVYGLKSEGHFPNALQENIRTRGAPNRLISDSATSETSKRVHVILNDLQIGDWQSEPHNQHQNPAERRWQDVKRISNDIMDRTGCYTSCWLLVLCYVMFVMNHIANPALNYDIPLQRLTGDTVDISILLRFPFWHKVYAVAENASYPSDSKEQLCYMVGFSETVGNAMTYKLLTCDTNKIIHRSSIRSAEDPLTQNIRAAPIDGDTIKQYIKSKHDGLKKVSMVEDELPLDVKGRSIVIPQENGERIRARVMEVVDDNLVDPTTNKQFLDSMTKQEREDYIAQHTKFRLQYDKSDREELLTYQQIMDYLDDDQKTERVWNFKRISSHEGPLTQTDKNYNGSTYNVMIEWENGETTTEPLNVIAQDDPITCALYAQENKLLELPGWKRFKTIARRQKKLFRMANQAKLRSFRTTPKYMYGIEIPRYIIRGIHVTTYDVIQHDDSSTVDTISSYPTHKPSL